MGFAILTLTITTSEASLGAIHNHRQLSGKKKMQFKASFDRLHHSRYILPSALESRDIILAPRAARIVRKLGHQIVGNGAGPEAYGAQHLVTATFVQQKYQNPKNLFFLSLW